MARCIVSRGWLFGALALLACSAHTGSATPLPTADVASGSAAQRGPAEEAARGPGHHHPEHEGSHRGNPAPAELVGQWARFWAPHGRAETVRFWFASDGSFTYRDPGSTERVRRGRYRTEDGMVVLTIEEEQASGGPVQRVAREEALTLGHCPPNEEARALDQHYACVSLEGEAFFRCSESGALAEGALGDSRAPAVPPELLP